MAESVPIVLSFSGGKDSVLAAARLRAGGWEISALLAAFVADERSLVMHGVPETLIASQAASLGLPLAPLLLPRDPPNAIYEECLAEALAPYRAAGVRHVAFGDLFLTDIRAYRDALMARLGFESVYPLWNENTRALADAFVREGYCGVTVCVDASRLSPEWVGRDLDASFFASLPPDIDPCGENGEFHSFVYGGPGFFYPVRFDRSAPRSAGRFHYCDLRARSANNTCPRCGTFFECGVKTGVDPCWCATLPPITPSTLTDRCLCPRCLQALIAESAIARR